MGLHDIVAQIDREIGQLKQARALLEGSRTSSPSRTSPKKRNLTLEGRKRIAEAVKRRWARERENGLVGTAGWVTQDSSTANLAHQSSPF